jgi:hypothetical protein
VMDRGRKPIDLGQPKLKNSLLEFFFWLFHFDSRRHQNPQVFSYIVYIVSQYGQFEFAYRAVSCRNRLFLHFKTKKRRGGGEYIYPAPSFPTRSWVCDVWHRDNTPPFFPTWLKSNKKGTLLFPSCILERRCFSLFCFVLFCVWFLSLWLLRFLRPRVDDVRVDGGERLTVGSDLRWMSRAWLRSTQPPTTTVHTPGVYSLWLYCAARVCVSLSIQWTNNIVDVLRHPIFSMWLYTIKTSGSWSLE